MLIIKSLEVPMVYGNDDITIVPNPAHNNIFITAPFRINTVEIVDVLGQVVLSTANMDYTSEINTSHLATGVYFVRINKQFVKKILKN
jgi:hypothetical protein